MGLGAQAREMAGKLLDAEVQEIAPTMIEGASTFPSAQGALVPRTRQPYARGTRSPRNFSVNWTRNYQ